MSINFAQFPLPRLPLQGNDLVVGYQLIGSVPTLAQYTLTQMFEGVFPGGIVPIANGGTGASTAPQALTNLGAASLLSNTFTGQQSINTFNSTQSLTITDTGTSGGANIRLVGSGGTTPNKSIRATGGMFNIVNDAYSVVILNLTDAGVMTTAGGITSTPISGSTGAFTTLSTPSATITGGTSNGMVIGNSTQAAGAFTTLIATGIITPNQTAGIVGTTTNNNANAGSVGEHMTAAGSAIPLTSGVSANITSLVLTPGDWEVTGSFAAVPAGTTQLNLVTSGLNTVSATLPAAPDAWLLQIPTLTVGAIQNGTVPSTRILIAVNTTVFLVAQANFTISTCTGTGRMRARRVR